MLDSHQRATGTQYTATASLLVFAFVFIPAALLFLRPGGYLTAAFALACSLVCVAFARVTWNRYSALTIPSIVARKRRVI